MEAPRLTTRRFLLRRLEVEDVGETYLSWFSDPAAAAHIEASRTTRTLDDLRRYVVEKLSKPDTVFLGIFSRDDGRHVGNMKFEPVDPAAGYAVLGIMIGEPRSRGTGVAREVIEAAAGWLRREGIGQIVLGVGVGNVPAIRAYEKSGFRVGATPHLAVTAETHGMILEL